MRKALCIAASAISALIFSSVGITQTDVEADPGHHKQEFENKCVHNWGHNCHNCTIGVSAQLGSGLAFCLLPA